MQSWIPDTHPETIHTRWGQPSDDPETGTCLGVHVRPEEAGRHFRATPSNLILEGSSCSIPGATLHRIPDDHVVILNLGHCKRIYAAILAENQLKNRAIATLVESLPAWARIQATTGDGNPLWEDAEQRSYFSVDGGARFIEVATRTYATVAPADLVPVFVCRPGLWPAWKFDVETGAVALSGPYPPEVLADLNAKVRAAHGDLVSVG